MPTRIVTDSSAELAPDVAAALDIIVLPMRFQIGADVVEDVPPQKMSDLSRRLARSKEPVAVLPPSSHAFSSVYAALAKEADYVVSLHVSAELNGTVPAANLARRSILGHCEIQVIDSGLISRALGILVTEAAKATQGGAEGPEVVRLVRGLIARIYLAFYVETMDHLRRSGLAPQRRVVTEGGAGFKPLYLIEDGRVTRLHRTRSRGTAVERLGEFAAEFTSLRELVVLHGSAAKPEPLEALLGQLLPKATAIEHQYGPVFTTYVGPQALGIVAFES
jgi:DegV family protein with EDD domain